MPITIDTLAAQRTMEAAGIEPAHAEAIVTAFAHTGDEVATKDDIRRLEQRLEVEINGVRTELSAAIKTEISALNNRVIGVVPATAALLYAALRIF